MTEEGTPYTTVGMLPVVSHESLETDKQEFWNEKEDQRDVHLNPAGRPSQALTVSEMTERALQVSPTLGTRCGEPVCS